MGITNSALFEFNDILNEEYSLIGQDGNAFALMGYTARCMKECGLKDEIPEMRERATASDYNNLICVCDEYVQRCNDIARDGFEESLQDKDTSTLIQIYNAYSDFVEPILYKYNIDEETYPTLSDIPKKLQIKVNKEIFKKLEDKVKNETRKYGVGNLEVPTRALDLLAKYKKNPKIVEESLSLTEKKWDYHLKNGPRLRKAINDENHEEVLKHLTESLNKKYALEEKNVIKKRKSLQESTSNTIKDYSWSKFLDKVEAATGFKVDSAYRRGYDQWIELIDDQGKIRDAEITKYFDGEYELNLSNISTYIHEEYSLVGQDGNAFSLIGYTARCMKECGLRDEITEMRERAMSGDYYNLIAVCDEYIQKCNEINPDIDESLNENLQDTLDKIIDNYNYYKNRNNAGLLSIKEEGLKAFEEFSIKYPVFKKALQSKIKDDFEKDLVKSNIGLAVQSTGLLNESLNEEAQKEVFDKPGEFWYFTKHGVGPGSVPKGITIEKTIDKDGGEYFLIKNKILSTYALNKYEIKEKSPEDVDEDWEKPSDNFAGWVAIYQGKKIEIPKNEANSLYDAKLKAIEKLKVPKSKVGLLVVQPGYNESLESNNKNVDEMSFDELLELWWEMNGQWGPVDMGMEPDEIDAYFKENPDELKYNVEQGLKWYE